MSQRIGRNRKARQLVFMFVIILTTVSTVQGQLGFFKDFWKPVNIQNPVFVDSTVPGTLPTTFVSIDAADTIRLISPYVGGYNLNTYHGGKIWDKPDLLENIRQLDLPFFRFPGGSGSNWYFWNKSKPDLPEDIDYMIIKDDTVYISQKIKWGDIPGADYLSLDDSYILRDSCKNEAIHVVNYPLARYGRAEDPVGQAAHLAADWVRYDNGRTRFWEIGNEIYGSWEPGYIIDTSRNKDGQPVVINGELYGIHCKVFLDSMRAAAAEIGADIKIGATLGFQEERSEWDIPLLQTLGDMVDFYIIHRYFGNGEDASPGQVLESINEFYQDKTHIDGLINQYCETYVPLVLTEWNTRYEGSLQNVSCTNGMHTILGYKAIINEGIGLSSKWNLIWTYQDGNTHGLISSEKDDVWIEGIPAYFPRAPYFYIYYFKKFLGDVSVNNFVSIADSVEAFSSLFTSGQAGITVLNTSASSKDVVLDLENYNYGSRFYWYTLQPENDQPFAPKVLVNGHTNENYSGGGPMNFSSLAPCSALSDNGIRINLPPFSATFILAEGVAEIREKNVKVNFVLYGEKDGEISPLSNALVQVGPKYYKADENGTLELDADYGELNYQLHTNGYESISGSILLNGDTLVDDTLAYRRFDLNVTLLDSEDNSVIYGCSVSLGNDTSTTGVNGQVSFVDLDYGKYELKYSSNAYKGAVNLDIYSDSSITVKIPKTLYNLGITALDSISMSPVIYANIIFNGNLYSSDLDGKLTVQGYYNTYTVLAGKQGYSSKEVSVELRNDTSIIVWLVPESADIKFRIYDGSTPVNKAEIILNDSILYTNALGLCTFANFPTGIDYNYSVHSEPYQNIDGTLHLLADTTIDLNYSEFLNMVEIAIIDSTKGFPVSSGEILLDNVFKISDNEGKASFNLKQGSYQLEVMADRYKNYAKTISVFKDTALTVPIKLEKAIIRFRITFNNEALSGITVKMNSQEIPTNVLGIAVMNDLTVDSVYDYSITADGYNPVESSLRVVHDSTLNVELWGTSMNYLSQDGVKVYPLPAARFINFHSDFIIHKIIVYDLDFNAKLTRTGINGTDIRLNIETLGPGVHIAGIYRDDDFAAFVKIIVVSE